MHVNAPWLRFPLPPPGPLTDLDLSQGPFVGAPTAAGPIPLVGDQLAMGPGGAIAAMQMQYLQALQSQAMFWTLPGMMAEAAQQLQQQGLAAGMPSQGWPEQIDPQQIAMLLLHWLLNGGQLPDQGRSAGALPGHCGGGCRAAGAPWGARGAHTPGSRGAGPSPGARGAGPSPGAPGAGPSSSAAGATPATPGSAPPGRGTSGDFLQAALAQNGDRYVYGAETNLNDPNPGTFDCSELVQWAAHQAGVTIPDGSSNQLAHVRRHGTEISVEEALRTPGALLFRPGHVAISLGDGRTIEAKGRNYGVGVFNGRGRFTSAGLVPGMRY